MPAFNITVTDASGLSEATQWHEDMNDALQSGVRSAVTILLDGGIAGGRVTATLEVVEDGQRTGERMEVALDILCMPCISPG